MSLFCSKITLPPAVHTPSGFVSSFLASSKVMFMADSARLFASILAPVPTVIPDGLMIYILSLPDCLITPFKLDNPEPLFTILTKAASGVIAQKVSFVSRLNLSHSIIVNVLGVMHIQFFASFNVNWLW